MAVTLTAAGVSKRQGQHPNAPSSAATRDGFGSSGGDIDGGDPIDVDSRLRIESELGSGRQLELGLGR